MPEGTRAVRYWDLAGPASRHPANPDPDYTAGLRLDSTMRTRTYYIVDLIRQRRHAGQVEDLMRATAEEDGPGVHIYIERATGLARRTR